MSAQKLFLSTKILLLGFFVFFGITIFSTPALAIISTSSAITKDSWSAVTQTTFTLDNITCGGLSLLAGYCPYDKTPARIISDSGEVKLGLFDKTPGGGAIGSITNLTVAMYSSPISSMEYLASLGENIGISSKPAYAQVTGSGEGIIKPVLKLWQVARNVAYLVFILVFIVIGFMIMFRQKLNPQTVISAQAALPGLVIGLILVTFSYFIAALLVDTAFLGVKLMTELFIQSGGPNALGSEQRLRELAANSNVFDLFTSTQGVVLRNTGEVGQSLTNTISSAFSPLTVLIPAIIGLLVGLLLGPVGAGIGFIGGGLTGAALPTLVPTVVSALISLILVVALFIQLFKLFFGLLGAYIQILINVILGPFLILFSAVPGNSGALSNWIKSILANALIFPAVFAMFLFAGAILGTPPTDWAVSPPLFGGLKTELLRIILAYGIILAIPVIPETIRTAFKVKGPQGFDKMALGGFMGGYGVAGGAFGKGYDATGLKAQRTEYRGAQNKVSAGIAGAVAPGVPPGRFGPAKQAFFRRWPF